MAKIIITTIKGFILIDVMVAVLLITLALVPISGLFIQSIQANTLAKDYTVATALAQKQLELLKTHSSEYWRSLATPCNIEWQDTLHPILAPYNLTSMASSTNDGLLVEVIVIVIWKNNNKDYKIHFVTYYPKL